MEGTIEKILDELTVTVKYSEKGKNISNIMRIENTEKINIKIGYRVQFNIHNKDAYRRIICRVVDERRYEK
ncbi:hypothetical protein [Shewanella oncorhynchi]|uniref:hypothetical protein n=1 Tax=Shewanella oncorhynchi TaxID=2726434 RepID=UPI003D7BD772